jgi:putative SOS response-associated peptidase YedK
VCGRYELHSSPAAIALAFGLKELPALAPRYNIAPTQPVPVVRLSRAGEREFAELRWGLVPFWAKDISIGNRMINARAETLANRPGFRDAYREKRCLLPADGFYEWAKLAGGKKQPVRAAMKNGEPFALAGLWSRWRPRDGGDPVETCTIVTTDANDLLQHVHDRMPVIVARGDYDRWLDVVRHEDPVDLLKPYPSQAMVAYPVSPRVSRPENDDPGLIEPLPLRAGAGG